MSYQPEPPPNQPPYQQPPYQQPGGRYQPAYDAPAPAAGLSIASMVLGIFSFIGGGLLIVPPLVGVVLGHLGLRREQPQGRGFAIAGLVLGYLALLLYVGGILLVVGIAVISLMQAGHH